MQPSGLPPDFGPGQSASGQSGFNGPLSVTGELNAGGEFPFPGAPLPYDDTGAPQVPKKGQSRNKQPKVKTLPVDLDIEGPSSNAVYQTALANSSLLFSPQALGFLPSNYWLAVDASFGDLVTKFFQRKNNANCRFPHKLYNALAVVDHDPSSFPLFGVQWVTDQVFKVDRLIFARLLGIVAIDGGLFHRQGNFPSHGFAELMGNEIEPLRSSHDVSDVDQDRVRLLYHRVNGFSKGSSEDSVTRCKWITEAEPRA
jgi:hypothetical protein